MSTLVHVRRHEESLRAIALNQSNLNMYKEKEVPPPPSCLVRVRPPPSPLKKSSTVSF